MRLFTPHELGTRLAGDGGLALLTSGARDRPPRQQTIRATIAWSHALLGPAQQRLFAWLGVFAGGWTLELAEGVCASDGDRDSNVLDGVQALVEHSLIQVVAQEHGRTFRMLETVRAFALERVRERGEEAPARARHLAACVALAEAAEPQVRGAAQLAMLSRLDGVHDNLRAALAWGLDTGDGSIEQRTLGLRLAAALWYYWYIRGHLREVRRWLDHPATADERVPPAVRARALLSHWYVEWHITGGASTLTSGARGLALARRSGDAVLLAQALLWSSDARERTHGWKLAQRIGDPWWHTSCAARAAGADTELSDQQRQRLLTAARASGDRMLIALVLISQVYWHLRLGDLQAAQRCAEEKLALDRMLDHQHGIATTLWIYSHIYDAQGNTGAARACHAERYAVERALDNQAGYGITLLDNARLAIWQAEYREAAELCATFDASIIEQSKYLSAQAAWTRGWLALEQGEPAYARTLGQDALAGIRSAPRTAHPGRSMYLDGNEVAIIWLLATIALSRDERAEAAALYEQSLTLLQALPAEQQRTNRFVFQVMILASVGEAVVGLSGFGRLAAGYADAAAGRRWLRTVIAIIRTTTGVWETTIERAMWGRALLGWGDYGAAAVQLAKDVRFYQRAGARRAVAEALEGLAACAGRMGDWTRAVRWWGASAALRTEIGAPMWACERPTYERDVAEARAALGAAAFDAAWAAGQAAAWRQAVAEALDADTDGGRP